ncbi:nucleotidyltransferase domain-containing protein [Sphingomonas sp. RP10(2022)]|uniref:Nucleotidyltransferase domain-containing protein n=1 Tax=Sphingomonas liriopis TaxID=2949094 RepID=A0A9X2HXM0_9SPHN|nr:nucleotidyltransferase domain-containing protein [Sphingomonas liriopis]MCP3734675.1 nucleotidyltransferase domain-containing protein [Sphingomonas liriopis]
MTRAEALERLRAREVDLRKLGIVRLAIFGSTARDEARPDSDVDLVAMIDYDAVRRLGPFGFFGIEGRIEEMLGTKVDFMTEPMDEAGLKAAIDRDRVHVF